MKTLTVGKLKADFSQVLADVEKGEEVVVSYGKNKKKVAVIVSFLKYEKRNPRVPGILAEIGTCRIADDFKITDNELFNL